MAEATHAMLDARLDAQRRVLRWILARMVTTPEQLQDLLDNLDQSVIPQDHQEDPGAVPDEAFGANRAFAAEMRAILDPVKRQHAARARRAGEGQPG
jgi:hypothetical protein